MRTSIASLLASATMLLAGCTVEPPQDAPTDAITTVPSPVAADYASVIASPIRTDQDRAADPLRKPADMLAFADVRPGMAVFEMLPGGGYFTRLFEQAIGAEGELVLYANDEFLDKPWKPFDSAQKLAGSFEDGTVGAVHFPLAGPVPDGMAERFDLVWTSRNYHDFHNAEGFDAKAYNGMVLDLLKPGGVYVVVDHAAPEGSGASSTNTTHRIEAEQVRRDVVGAGFLYDGASAVLANPNDPRDISVHDPSVKGDTDQFVLRFRKPG
ncbi:class I SAM-dependent methyltransferase [Croceicoccus naphthovorans]|uniref:Uncharacterized protein n=1 Tax=Croceicoccus naphthovorans TaxID=1348774 RepID=A0A0G3XIP3_9SPHN|nr:class I SAM-dependent methyltransferase [Croceicoccus naphthovorans]AKM10489.1 hypothetical protein AB433_11790 [Croceicoccus naphthovorans]MBB3988671.1 putative methyltransferase [Croceicoccus naphthovorans]